MSYQPIENYGLIGDLHTVALVGLSGSIDWLCYPHFDSPSIFAALLDHGKGGHFRIYPAADGSRRKQFYWPDTNVLVTRFLHPDGVGQIIDFMPLDLDIMDERPHQVVRRVQVIRGAMTFRLECFPAFNYARDQHATDVSQAGACFRTATLSVALATSLPLERHARGVAAEFTLQAGETAIFVLGEVDERTGPDALLSEDRAEALTTGTVEYWRRWLSRCTYR
jgi:GH15 family glucan-1,4-alpha-glucosidase